MWQGLDLSVRQFDVGSLEAKIEYAHVGVDATVSTVCASSLLGGLVDLDVLNDEVAGVETLSIGVGLGVLQETEQELGRLDGPAGAGDTELLSYLASTVSSLPFHISYPIANSRKQPSIYTSVGLFPLVPAL